MRLCLASLVNRHRVIYRAALPVAGALAVALAPTGARADYIYSGPNNGQWSTPGNWTTVNPATPTHDPITFYPGDTANGSDPTTTVNINNGIANSNVNFNLGTATASIGRFYIGSNNQGPGSTDPFYTGQTIQPQQLTIQSGSLIVNSTQFAIIGRHVNGKVIQTGGTFDTGQVLRFNDTTAGVNASYEYHAGDLLSGLGFTGSNPGIRLGNAAGTSGTMTIYNDGPGHIWVKSYYSATAKAASGGFANIGLTEFHYKSGNVRTVRVGDATAGANQVSLRNDATAPATNYSSQLNLVMDQAASTSADGVPNSMALFTTPSVATGAGTDYAVFYMPGGGGRYLDRGSTYNGTGGRAFDAATDSFVVTSSFGGTTYAWDISYSGKGNWDAGFDNITSVTGHGTGTDIVLVGRSAFSGAQWTSAADGNWSTGPWTGGTPNGVGAGANFFQANSTTGNVTVNVDSNVTVGSIQFDNINKYTPGGLITTKYTLGGTGSITVQAPGATQGFIRTVDGSHTITADLVLASDTRVNVGGTDTLSFNSFQPTSKGITKTGSGTLAVNHLRTGPVNVTAGTVRVKANGGSNGVSVIDSVTIDPAAGLDTTDNDLVVNNMAFTDVKNLVLSGFGSPTGGITSSTSDGSQILALFDNAIIGAGDWQGVPIGPNATVGKYTYFGDVNFDGQVTGDDYTIVDSNLNTTPPVGFEWLSGDANLDGIVTGDDYTTIDSNLGLGSGNPLSASSLSVVPEPGSIALIAAPVALGLVRRRRRQLSAIAN